MVNTRSAAGSAEEKNNTGSTMRANPLSASGLGEIVAKTPLAGLLIILDSQDDPPPVGPHDANNQFWHNDSLYELSNHTPDDFNNKNQPMNNAKDASYNITINVVKVDNQAKIDEEIA